MQETWPREPPSNSTRPLKGDIFPSEFLFCIHEDFRCMLNRGLVFGFTEGTRRGPSPAVTHRSTRNSRSSPFLQTRYLFIRPFLSEHAAQLLALSRLNYCNALLAGLPANSFKPLQLIQNAAARLIFNEQKRTHVTPLFINLHCYQ